MRSIFKSVWLYAKVPAQIVHDIREDNAPRRKSKESFLTRTFGHSPLDSHE